MVSVPAPLLFQYMERSTSSIIPSVVAGYSAVVCQNPSITKAC
jgi:hypothetical protein